MRIASHGNGCRTGISRLRSSPVRSMSAPTDPSSLPGRRPRTGRRTRSLLAACLALAPSAAAAQAGGAGPPGAAALADAAWPPPGIRLARELAAAAPDVRWAPDGRLLYSVRRREGISWRALDPKTGTEAPYTPPAGPSAPRRRVVHAGLFTYRPPVFEAASPDGRWFAGTHGGNVWVRPGIGDDSVQATADGTADFGYDVDGAKWSPDERVLAVKKLDARGVPTVPLVDWNAPGQPVARHPYSRAGEPIERAELYVVDRTGGDPVRVGPGSSDAPYVYIVGWSRNGRELYFTRTTRLMKQVTLLAADSRTGRARTILTETSPTYVGGPVMLRGNDLILDVLRPFRLLSDGRRLIWTSARDGWHRLYLYDVAGKLIRPLTPSGSDVAGIQAVDERRGLLYYTAPVDSAHPYDIALFRVRLSGGDPQKLLTGPTFPRFRGLAFDSARDFFWVRRGGVDRAPVVEVRRADGRLVRTLWSGEAIARAAGWKPPEPVTAKASDGKTDLYGLLFKPRGFEPRRRYPVVLDVYPFDSHVPRTLSAGASDQALADLGFIVMVVDGRGAGGRGLAFRDAFYGEFGQHEVADQVAALKRVAADRPWMDMDRVGVMGGSWGGYETLRAMVLEPDLFRAGVASAPAADLRRFRVSIEPFMGCLPKDCPDAYDRGAVTPLLDRLKGKLMILHGTRDDDVPFGETMDLVAALRRAGKPYQLVVFPGGDHSISWRPDRPYWWLRATGFLRESLGGPEAR